MFKGSLATYSKAKPKILINEDPFDALLADGGCSLTPLSNDNPKTTKETNLSMLLITSPKQSVKKERNKENVQMNCTYKTKVNKIADKEKLPLKDSTNRRKAKKKETEAKIPLISDFIKKKNTERKELKEHQIEIQNTGKDEKSSCPKKPSQVVRTLTEAKNILIKRPESQIPETTPEPTLPDRETNIALETEPVPELPNKLGPKQKANLSLNTPVNNNFHEPDCSLNTSAIDLDSGSFSIFSNKTKYDHVTTRRKISKASAKKSSYEDSMMPPDWRESLLSNKGMGPRQINSISAKVMHIRSAMLNIRCDQETASSSFEIGHSKLVFSTSSQPEIGHSETLLCSLNSWNLFNKVNLTIEEKILEFCNQSTVTSFEEGLEWQGSSYICKKLGEGTYGEVFSFKSSSSNENLVLKVMPVKCANSEDSKTLTEIWNELIISKELSDLSTKLAIFTKLHKACLVSGCYPQILIREWDKYNKSKTSENKRPDCFQSNQLYVLLFMANGGANLEEFKIEAAEEAKAIFEQVACGLAMAEEKLKFEHRDLHLGNILIKPCFVDNYTYCIDDAVFYTNTAKLQVSIIDFSLSRIEKGGQSLYADVSHEKDLFKGKGDPQYTVYRDMRKHNKNKWELFCPFTNNLWLKYILVKLLNPKLYKKEDFLINRSSLQTMRSWKSVILQYHSVKEFVVDNFSLANF